MKRIRDILARHKTPVTIEDDVTYKEALMTTCRVLEAEIEQSRTHAATSSKPSSKRLSPLYDFW